MNARAATLIAELGLQPHPEGGWYRQTFKSDESVVRGSDEAQRSALTGIYFLLANGQRSRLHRVASDEVWTHLEGAPILLTIGDETKRLAPLAEGGSPFLVVPRLAWQEAEVDGEYALAACFVAPGFEFDDFEMAE
jgi:predicted cupin superfamily sugar epimerase